MLEDRSLKYPLSSVSFCSTKCLLGKHKVCEQMWGPPLYSPHLKKDLELARGPGPPEYRPGFWVSHVLMKAEQCSLKSLPLCKRLIGQQVWVPPGIPVLVYFVSMTRNCWVCVQTLMAL